MFVFFETFFSRSTQVTARSARLPEQLEADAEVTAEVEVVEHVYHVVHALLVAPPQVVQDADLDEGLVVESLLVPAKHAMNNASALRVERQCNL